MEVEDPTFQEEGGGKGSSYLTKHYAHRPWDIVVLLAVGLGESTFSLIPPTKIPMTNGAANWTDG